MFISYRLILLASALALCVFPVRAFDNDLNINDIDLRMENFLDIKAHRFRKSLEYQWYDNTTGWRINSASLNIDQAFMQTELKLQHELSDYLDVRLALEQAVFYADKDLPLPTAEIVLYPWASDVGFSLLITPAYEKSEMDIGYAVILGKRPWNYARFEYIEVDTLYNDKNTVDNSFYREAPITMKLEAAYQFADQYKLRFTLKRDQQLVLVDPDSNSLFTHEADNFSLLLDYQPLPDSVIGISLNGFTLDKSSTQATEDQQQDTDYVSVDVYWVKGMGKAYEFRFGTQYDYISNTIRDRITSSNDHDYFMKTLQLYATAYHPFNEHMAWDFGLYVGEVEEQRDYLLDNSKDTLNEDVEIKFRSGFVYSSSDGRNSLQFNFSLNIDDLSDDPGDGAGVSFQSVF